MRNGTRHIAPYSSLGIAAFVFVVGCTPEDQQAVRDAGNMVIQNGLEQVIGFAIDFARQMIAAFLL